MALGDPYAGGAMDPQIAQFIGQNQQLAQAGASQGYQSDHHKGPLSASGATGMAKTSGQSQGQGATPAATGQGYQNPAQGYGNPTGAAEGAVDVSGGGAAAGAADSAATAAAAGAGEADLAALF